MCSSHISYCTWTSSKNNSLLRATCNRIFSVVHSECWIWRDTLWHSAAGMKNFLCINCVWILSAMSDTAQTLLQIQQSVNAQCFHSCQWNFQALSNWKDYIVNSLRPRLFSCLCLDFPPKISHHCYHQCNSNGCSNGESTNTEWLLASQFPLTQLAASLGTAFVEIWAAVALFTLALPVVGNFWGEQPV